MRFFVHEKFKTISDLLTSIVMTKNDLLLYKIIHQKNTNWKYKINEKKVMTLTQIQLMDWRDISIVTELYATLLRLIT